MMNDFAISPLDEKDLENILAVYQQCEDFLALGPQRYASTEMVKDDLAHSQQEAGAFCGIYLPEQGLVGVVDYLPAFFEGHPEQAFISLLMIARPFRGQGLGQAVVNWLETQIREQQGVETVLSAVQVNNSSALRFWKKQGYRIEAGPSLQPDGTTVFLLRKELMKSQDG
jgi:ribosomal protein S18 acetylase RimI-like enzyme